MAVAAAQLALVSQQWSGARRGDCTPDDPLAHGCRIVQRTDWHPLLGLRVVHPRGGAASSCFQREIDMHGVVWENDFPIVGVDGAGDRRASDSKPDINLCWCRVYLRTTLCGMQILQCFFQNRLRHSVSLQRIPK